MLAIYLSLNILGCFEVCSLAAGFADAAGVRVHIDVVIFVAGIINAVHAEIVLATSARSSTCASSGSFIVASQSVSSRESSSTFIACVGSFSGV